MAGAPACSAAVSSYMLPHGGASRVGCGTVASVSEGRVDLQHGSRSSLLQGPEGQADDGIGWPDCGT